MTASLAACSIRSNLKYTLMERNVLFLGLLLFVGILNAQESYVVDTHKSPKAIMYPATIDEVHWTNGFWAERYEQTSETTLRKLWDLAADPDAGHVLDNFRAAGTGEGEHQGKDWQDAWLYKWIESASAIYETTNDPWILDHLNEAIELISAAQQEDGYISTQITVKNKPRFTLPREHEVYNMGHLLTAACVHKRVTGETSLFDVAARAADFLCETLGEKVSPSFAHNPSAIMGMVEMYRETGNDKYLDCARLIVDSRGSNPKPGGIFYKGPGIIGTDFIQDRVPLRQSKEVVGHNVFFTYLYAGATDVYMETGDESLMASLEHLWYDLTHTKMCINGGVSPMGHGLSKGNDPVVESVGDSYNLPVANSYNETCGQVGNFMWNYRMLMASGDAKYADIMELELYNGFLGGIGLDGESWFYRNSLRLNSDFEELKHSHNFEATRNLPGKGRICCPTNLLRTLSELQAYFYSTDDKGIWIHHYGGNTLTTELTEGKTIQLTQKTDYPWDGKINISIDDIGTDKKTTIRVRIPGWANNSKVKVNGKSLIEVPVPGTYFSVNRKWEKGDEIELNLPMPARLMVANPKAEQLRNQVAVMRGPVLYCLESKDLPEDKNIDNVRIQSEIKLKVAESEFPFGIKTLEGKAYYFDEKPWEGDLYRPLKASKKMERLTISLIPYFAWNNRGPVAMSVWLPLDVN